MSVHQALYPLSHLSSPPQSVLSLSGSVFAPLTFPLQPGRILELRGLIDRQVRGMPLCPSGAIIHYWRLHPGTERIFSWGLVGQ